LLYFITNYAFVLHIAKALLPQWVHQQKRLEARLSPLVTSLHLSLQIAD